MTPVWKEIPGVFGYEASFCGQIRSVDRILEMKNGVSRTYRGRILKPGFHSEEFRYPQVNLGKAGNYKVHYLVAITWVGPKPGDHYQIRHLDGNPENRAATNLQWGTPAENQADRFIHGTASIGEKHGKSFLTNSDVIEIRRELEIKTVQLDIANKFGISQSLVSHIKTGKLWSHL